MELGSGRENFQLKPIIMMLTTSEDLAADKYTWHLSFSPQKIPRCGAVIPKRPQAAWTNPRRLLKEEPGPVRPPVAVRRLGARRGVGFS